MNILDSYDRIILVILTGGVEMEILKTVILILFAIDCIALSIVVLLQEGKSAGLGSIAGSGDSTYWSQNKGRSKEGMLAKVTKVLAVVFIVLAAVLNLSVFN